MTTIVAVTGAMGSDTFVSSDTGVSYPARKVVRIKGDLIGAAGDSGDCLRFLEWAKHDFAEKKRPKFTCASNDENEAHILLVNAEGIFTMSTTDPYPEEILSPYWAIGSGGDAALGALAKGATLEEALEIAARFDMYTKAPFHVEKLKP